MATYETAALELLDYCGRYETGAVGLESLKAAVWRTADSLADPESRDLREFLQRAEGRLDMVQHTVSDGEIFDASLTIVGEMRGRVETYLQ